MEDLDFIVDTKASDDSELLNTFNNPFPVFSGSKFSLAVDSDAEESEDESNDDGYFGEYSTSLFCFFN